MEPIKDITQKEIKEVFDNPVDQAGNKIKLRNVSHENLVRHLQNIPYKKENVEKTKTSNTNSQKEKSEWTLTAKESMECIEIAKKPINVKENMIENIRKHSEKMDLEDKKLDTTSIETKEEQNEQTQKLSDEKTKDINNNNNKQEEIASSKKDKSSTELNIDEDFEEIKNIRQEVLNKKEAAEQAQKEADESDKTVQELGIQYTEVQKQLQEAKAKNKEMKQKVLVALRSQSTTLINAKKQYESLIEDANKRKELNQNKIAEINPKIKTVEDETISLNNDTAKAEEFLNAIYSNNIVEFPYENMNEEEKIRKIA